MQRWIHILSKKLDNLEVMKTFWIEFWKFPNKHSVKEIQGPADAGILS